MRSLLTLLLATALGPLYAIAQPDPAALAAWTPHTFTGHDGDPLPFRVARPDPTAFTGPRPLVIFLHGAGERGVDNVTQLRHGAARLAEGAGAYGALVVAPQCPATDYWGNLTRSTEVATGRVSLDWVYRPAPTISLRAVIGLIDSLVATGEVDTTQLHLVGLSMGAIGSLELATRQHGRYASVTSMAGAYGPQVAPILALTPRLRFFHGGDDELVHHSVTAELVRRLRVEGADPVYVEFPGVGHDSWTPGFARDDFWTWILGEG